jgi:hypothetical protein
VPGPGPGLPQVRGWGYWGRALVSTLGWVQGSGLMGAAGECARHGCCSSGPAERQRMCNDQCQLAG